MKPERGLALIIRSRPFEHRAARTELDMALAAAALDFELEIYFEGDAVLQLLEQRQPVAAGLPRGHRAWAALPDLATVRIFADAQWLDRCADRKLKLVLPVEKLGAGRSREGWRCFRHALVL